MTAARVIFSDLDIGRVRPESLRGKVALVVGAGVGRAGLGRRKGIRGPRCVSEITLVGDMSAYH